MNRMMTWMPTAMLLALVGLADVATALSPSPVSVSTETDRAAKREAALAEAEKALTDKDRAGTLAMGTMALQQWHAIAKQYRGPADRQIRPLVPDGPELRDYQRARGLEPTGVMNATTWVRLIEDLDLIRKLELARAISLPGLAEPIWVGGDHVSVDGAWVILGHASKFPLQSSKLVCERSAGTCRETQVEFSDNGRFMVSELEYTILSWTSAGLSAVSASECWDYIINIRKPDPKKPDQPGLVTGSRAWNHRAAAASERCRGPELPNLSLRLDPGSKAQQEYREDLLKQLGLELR
jgi:hypothetical protein